MTILTRVPVQSLIRFRGVCKHWYDVIFSNPLFTDFHSGRRYHNVLYSPGFICHRPNKKYDFDNHRLVYVDLDQRNERVIPYAHKEIKDFQACYKRIKILHSLNGLLLISCKTWARNKNINIRVYNPFTGCSIILPELPVNVLSQKHCRYGLAYDTTIERYKVVCCGDDFCNGFFCKVITLGVGRDAWRDVVIPKEQSGDYFRSYSSIEEMEDKDYFRSDFIEKLCPPVYANGSLHWSAPSNTITMYTEETQLILSVDVSKEIFYTIRPPKHYFSEQRSFLLEMDGLLCFVDNYVTSTQFKLWVLEGEKNNYYHNCKWRESCSIDMGHLEEDNEDDNEEDTFMVDYHGKGLLNPFAILTHPERKIIFWKLFEVLELDHHGEIEECIVRYYSYDMELKTSELIYQGDERRPHYWHMSTASLT